MADKRVMKIRAGKQEDLEQLMKLAEKHNILLPGEGTIFVAETEAGKIEGFVNMRSVMMIEPFICENPLVANKIWEYIKERSEKGNIKILRCFAQKKHTKLFKRLGFYRIFAKNIPLEINFY